MTVKGGAKIPLFLDCIWKKAWPLDDEGPPPQEDGGGDRMRKFCINRHNGAINGVFLDGAAKKIALKQLWTLKWHRRFDNRNNSYAKPSSASWPGWMASFANEYN